MYKLQSEQYKVNSEQTTKKVCVKTSAFIFVRNNMNDNLKHMMCIKYIMDENDSFSE